MRQSKAVAAGSVAYMLCLIGLCLALGWIAASVWVGLLLFGGFLALHVAFNRAIADEFRGVFWLAWGGAWAVSYAGTLAEYAGRWLWSIPWVLAAIILLSIGGAAMQKSTWVASAGVILGLWSLAWAVVGPLWLFEKDQEETRDVFLDLWRDWWWVPVAIFVGIVVVGMIAGLASWSIARRRRRPARPARPRRPAAPAPGAGPHPVGPSVPPAGVVIPTGPAVGKPDIQRIVAGAAAPKAKPGAPDAVPRPKPPLPGDEGTILVSSDPGTILVSSDPGTVLSGSAGGELLYRAPGPVVDMAVQGADHFVLREDGHLARWHGAHLADVPDVRLDRPAGLAAGGDIVVAADRSRHFVAVRCRDGEAADIDRHVVDYTIECIAVNPFGTIVAYAPARRPTLFGVLLASGEQQVLAEGVEGATALAFSADGRYLAAGTREGAVVVVDMAVRDIVATLVPPRGGAVASLAPCPGGGWIAGHADGEIVRWDAHGDPIAVTREMHHITSVAAGSRRVAIGCDDGHVTVHPVPLEAAVFDDDLGTDPVVRIAFGEDEHTVLAAARDGSVWRAAV